MGGDHEGEEGAVRLELMGEERERVAREPEEPYDPHIHREIAVPTS